METALKGKIKIVIFIFISLLIIIVCYKLSLKKTIVLYNEYVVATRQNSQPDRLFTEITNLERQLSSLEGTILKSNSNFNPRNQIMNHVSSFCEKNDIRFKEMAAPLIYNDENFSVETNVVKIEGTYKDLLLLSHNMEKEFSLGKIVSINFFVEINRKSKTKELIGEIIIQNIKTNELN